MRTGSTGNNEMELSTPQTPPRVEPRDLPSSDNVPEVEVSMVEAAEVTGVTFSPELWMQRRHWALEVLRKEGVKSVLDIGCGPGALLETLILPPSTISEPPILSRPSEASTSQLPSPVDSDAEEAASQRELFINRLGGLDVSQNVIASALSIITPPLNPSPPFTPRYEPLTTELWLGGIEKYNSWLEGYEAIVALELIEHLDPNVLSRFGVVTLGTYRPRLLLVTTPNFDFNSKFPRANAHDHDHGNGTGNDFAKKGFIDPTGRTERVFRHSDHKVEMTAAEFKDWAEGAAADWGYDVEISGVGVSSNPSYYPANDPNYPNLPIYASQTAIFRLASGVPTRSPRSVRSSELPFLSKESSRPHKLAGRYTWPSTVSSIAGETAGGTRIGGGQEGRASVKDVLSIVRKWMNQWDVGEISMDELWGKEELGKACKGSKRYLVGCLGGFGDVPPEANGSGGERNFEVERKKGRGLVVRWKGRKSKGLGIAEGGDQWQRGDIGLGQEQGQKPDNDNDNGDVRNQEAAGGW